MVTEQNKKNNCGFCGCECSRKKNILAALDRAKETFGKPVASAFNPHFKSKYVPLSGWYNISKPSLAKQDIEIQHFARCCERTGKTVFNTRLLHKPSGEYLEDERYEVADRPGPQAHGSCDTYFKRYALRSLFALDVGEDDDDGDATRAYFDRCAILNKYIQSRADAEKVFSAVKEQYGITEIKQLGDGGLFDAFIFAMKFKG